MPECGGGWRGDGLGAMGWVGIASHCAPQPKPRGCSIRAHDGPFQGFLGVCQVLSLQGPLQGWLCSSALAPVHCPPPPQSHQLGANGLSPPGLRDPPCPVFLPHLAACTEPVNHTAGGRGPRRGPEVLLGLGAGRAAPGVRTAMADLSLTTSITSLGTRPYQGAQPSPSPGKGSCPSTGMGLVLPLQRCPGAELGFCKPLAWQARSRQGAGRCLCRE